MVVDDSPTVIEIVKSILVGEGYEVITASDGSQALNLAREKSPDLIILDIMLPKLDGYRVCRLLKFDQKYKHIPILMFTAKTEERSVETGMKTGADAYLTKPIEAEKLIEAVNNFLKK